MNSLANSVTRLKWSAVVFAVLWTGGMIWWSGDYDRVNVVMLTICGAPLPAISGTDSCAGIFSARACCREM